MKKNVGRLDQLLLFCLAILIVWFGLFNLGGSKGSIIGIAISICSLLPLYMVVTRKCFVFQWFNLSSIGSLYRTKKWGGLFKPNTIYSKTIRHIVHRSWKRRCASLNYIANKANHAKLELIVYDLKNNGFRISMVFVNHR